MTNIIFSLNLKAIYDNKKTKNRYDITFSRLQKLNSTLHDEFKTHIVSDRYREYLNGLFEYTSCRSEAIEQYYSWEITAIEFSHKYTFRVEATFILNPKLYVRDPEIEYLENPIGLLEEGNIRATISSLLKHMYTSAENCITIPTNDRYGSNISENIGNYAVKDIIIKR